MKATLSLSSLLLAATAASAQTSSSPTSSSSDTTLPTTLPGLLASLPHCALGCLAQAATAIHCAPTDFACLCAGSSDLVASVGPCIITGSGCSPADISKLKDVAPQLCGTVQADQNSTDVAAASSFVASALATVTGTPTSTPNAAAARTGGAVLGAVGIAGAFVVLGL